MNLPNIEQALATRRGQAKDRTDGEFWSETAHLRHTIRREPVSRRAEGQPRLDPVENLPVCLPVELEVPVGRPSQPRAFLPFPHA